MRITKIVEIPKYNEHSELKELNKYKKNNSTSKEDQLCFSEILKRVEERN